MAPTSMLRRTPNAATCPFVLENLVGPVEAAPLAVGKKRVREGAGGNQLEMHVKQLQSEMTDRKSSKAADTMKAESPYPQRVR